MTLHTSCTIYIIAHMSLSPSCIKNMLCSGQVSKFSRPCPICATHPLPMKFLLYPGPRTPNHHCHYCPTTPTPRTPPPYLRQQGLICSRDSLPLERDLVREFSYPLTSCARTSSSTPSFHLLAPPPISFGVSCLLSCEHGETACGEYSMRCAICRLCFRMRVRFAAAGMPRRTRRASGRSLPTFSTRWASRPPARTSPPSRAPARTSARAHE